MSDSNINYEHEYLNAREMAKKALEDNVLIRASVGRLQAENQELRQQADIDRDFIEQYRRELTQAQEELDGWRKCNPTSDRLRRELSQVQQKLEATERERDEAKTKIQNAIKTLGCGAMLTELDIRELIIQLKAPTKENREDKS